MSATPRSRSAQLRRGVRRGGGRLIRRLGLLPEGDPDGLGDDDALRGQSLPFTVMLYFPDTLTNLYQLRQWYAPLRALDERHRVGVVCLDSRVAAALRSECGMPVVCCGRVAVLEELVSRSDVALALYVNHNVRNLHPLRFPTILHAYLGHGESDKAASASNQVKAYDFVLVAGEAGRARLARNLMRYDVDAHVRTIGRPQLDGAGRASGGSEEPAARAGGRPTVLYAPTWEGAQPSMAYSSVLSHADDLLNALLASRRFRVVYRPHPRTGANRAEFAVADRRLQELIGHYRAADPDGGHRVDLDPRWDARADPADLLVGDVSAVASDWMSTGKPLILTRPVDPSAVLEPDGLLSAVPVLIAPVAGAVPLVERELAGGDVLARRTWVRRAMGDVAAGVATARFLDTCDELIALRGKELRDRAARLAGPP
ncbi:MAG: CDP-glycerol glycerophosphotransferase family protein [Jatrophihabitantaceae bacterium]